MTNALRKAPQHTAVGFKQTVGHGSLVLPLVLIGYPKVCFPTMEPERLDPYVLRLLQRPCHLCSDEPDVFLSPGTDQFFWHDPGLPGQVLAFPCPLSVCLDECCL